MSVISFVILHYGNVQVTKECVDSILQLHTEDDIHMLVVDNDTNKSDEERQLLKQRVLIDSRIEVLEITEKSGFSRANNEGYAYTRKMHSPDYVVVTNNDIVFEQKDFITKMKDSYSKNPYAVLSPDIVSRENGQHQSPISVQGRSVFQVNYTIWMNRICLILFPLIYPLLQRNYNKNKVMGVGQQDLVYKENIVPCGACIIVSKRFVEQEQKIFMPETNFYYEEYILYQQCQRKEYKILFDPELQVIHGDGIATKENKLNEKKRLKFVMKETLEAAKVYKELLQNSK